MEIKKIRDLSLISIDDKKKMVIACDSCGGIGMKAMDVLKVPPFYVGRFTTRVALLEVLSTGAEVVTITNTICNEMEPTGKEIIKGILEELKEACLKDIILTGSTEENFITNSTALGITVIGIALNSVLKVNRVKEEALIISIGLPKFGDEINLTYDNQIVDYNSIKELLLEGSVYEIVPVGSKGIAYEVEQLAINNKMLPYFNEGIKVDLKKSSGPATCVIAAININSLKSVLNLVPNVNIIGYLKK
ncbi:MAG TPA: AIR synthase related protein [Clostridiaceae bacterium]